jgi:hypothetical protein
VYRFGSAELVDEKRARVMLDEFFTRPSCDPPGHL